MLKVFVDTVAWIAILNEDDALHLPATQAINNLLQQKVPLLTTEFILLEVADALSAPRFRPPIVEFIQDCWRSPVVEVVPAGHTLVSEGLQLFSQRFDKDWGLTDCISFIVMQNQDITQALTSDRHFEQAGFRRLL